MSSPTDRPDKPDDQIAEGEFVGRWPGERPVT
jgi:hypothetical protein